MECPDCGMKMVKVTKDGIGVELENCYWECLQCEIEVDDSGDVFA